MGWVPPINPGVLVDRILREILASFCRSQKEILAYLRLAGHSLSPFELIVGFYIQPTKSLTFSRVFPKGCQELKVGVFSLLGVHREKMVGAAWDGGPLAVLTSFKHPLYKLYMRLIIKGPPSQHCQHFPYEGSIIFNFSFMTVDFLHINYVSDSLGSTRLFEMLMCLLKWSIVSNIWSFEYISTANMGEDFWPHWL